MLGVGCGAVGGETHLSLDSGEFLLYPCLDLFVDEVNVPRLMGGVLPVQEAVGAAEREARHTALRAGEDTGCVRRHTMTKQNRNKTRAAVG